jgi:hypothetical protein
VKQEGVPLTLCFSPHTPERAFGPRFFIALQEMGKWQAKRIRHLEKEIGDQVVSIRFEDTYGDQEIKKPPILNARVIHRFMEALGQCDERIFDPTLKYFEPGTRPAFTFCELKLASGKTVRLHMVIAPLHPVQRNPYWLRFLWSCLSYSERSNPKRISPPKPYAGFR